MAQFKSTQEHRPPNNHQRSANTDTPKHIFYVPISDDDSEADPEKYIPHGYLEPEASTNRHSPKTKDTTSVLDEKGLDQKIKELEAKINHLQDRLKKLKNYLIYNIYKTIGNSLRLVYALI